MKKSEYHEKRIVHHERAMGYYCRGGASAEGRTAVLRADLDVEAAEAAGVAWDPEEPEGFQEWFAQWWDDGCGEVPDMREAALAAWMAAVARQEAQQRTNEATVDPEVRREEIEAQIESWLGYYGYGFTASHLHPDPLSRETLRGMGRHLLSRLGVS